MNFGVEWSEEDQEWVGACDEWPSLSYLDPVRDDALAGIAELANAVRDDVAVVGRTGQAEESRVG